MIMMDDAQDLYDHTEDAMGEDVHGGNAEIESNGLRNQETPPYIVETMSMRLLRVELQSCRETMKD